ncbi:MAG: antitoxin family protein [Methanothrix sp.]
MESRGSQIIILLKARYENIVRKPLAKLDLMEGEEVDIELKKKRLFAILCG